MKTSPPHRPLQSTWLRIAARASNVAAFKALALSPTPFADLMLYPEKLEAVLKTLETWKRKAAFTPKQVARLLRVNRFPARRVERATNLTIPWTA